MCLAANMFPPYKQHNCQELLYAIIELDTNEFVRHTLLKSLLMYYLKMMCETRCEHNLCTILIYSH